MKHIGVRIHEDYIYQKRLFNVKNILNYIVTYILRLLLKRKNNS